MTCSPCPELNFIRISASCTCMCEVHDPRTGMLKATQLCLQLKEDGICTAGIPCFSFVFLNAGTAQRTLENPLGREELEYIQKSNTITARACLLWLLCTVRYVYFFIEQPQSSRLFIFPYLEHVVKQLRRFMGVYKSFLYLGLIYIFV